MAKKRVVKFYKDGKRFYEICIILEGVLTADDVKLKIQNLKTLIQENAAEVVSTMTTSLKSYAYPINDKNNKKGYYALFIVKAAPAEISEISRKISIQDGVLRRLVILKDPHKQSCGMFDTKYEEESPRKSKFIAYDDPNVLIKFLGERGKIDPRKTTLGKRIQQGLAKRQRVISRQVKRARFISLLPYIEE